MSIVKQSSIIYDIIGIGLGPFNLGLAAILQDLPELNSLFVEQNKSFDWHPGLLLPTARMQVPFYADLITIVNPQSPFTYTNFLQKTGRFFRYANHDNIFPLRIEYNHYCQWVAAQLPNICFGQRCDKVWYDERSGIYKVECQNVITGSISVFHTKQVVLGTGTLPTIPQCLQQLAVDLEMETSIIHSSNYLFYKSKLLTNKNITIIGSGQSAAEIFNDLLSYADELESLSWYTRSNRFHPMDYSRFTTEMTSMDYIDYFYDLDPIEKVNILKKQQYLYKGINSDLITQINDALYIRYANGGKNNIHIQANTELLQAHTGPGQQNIRIHFKNRETQYHFNHTTEAIIAATGYQYQVPQFLDKLKEHIQWSRDVSFQVNKNYSIDRNNTLFVQNADLRTHGFNSADLGMGPYRNAVIINSILKREHFSLERNTGFQSF